MKYKRFFVSVILVAVLFSNQGLYVFASNLKEAQKKQSEIQSQRADAQSELNRTRTEKRTVQEELDALEEELTEATRVLEGIEQDLSIKQDELAQVEEELEKTQIARDKQFASFKERSRYIYMNGSMSYVEVILNAKSITDLIKRIDYVNRIVEYDKNLVTELKKSELAISDQLTKVQKQKDELEILESFHTAKLHNYEESVAQKGAYIEELKKDEVEKEKILDQFDAAAKDVEKLIKAYQDEEKRKAAAAQAKAQSTAVYKYDGNQLQWPVPGRTTVSSGYINRINPVTGKREFHTGIDIPAPYGTNIVSAENGTVIFSGWKSGYGNTVIVDHGGGLSTLYGHNSSLLVSSGQKVSRGQAIAKCGSTGISTGNHCHFEVQINGKHTNPTQYTTAR